MTYSEEKIRSVAAIYAEAAAAGSAPTRAVVTATGMPKATASRYISRARSLGLLDPVKVGKSGKANVRALKVADALGVDYQRFVEAVRTHADGDIRISLTD